MMKTMLTPLMMTRRNYLRLTSSWFRKVSSSSSSNNDIIVDLESKTGIAVVKWNRKPVNSLALEFVERNLEVLRSLETNKNCRGLVLTSAIPNVFCAGLDFMQVTTSDRPLFTKYMKAVCSLVSAYRLTDLPIVAAVNGSAIAGGCIVASSCDYRVMISTKGVIGVSEVHLGFAISNVISSIYVELLGHHKAELALVNGILFKPVEALDVGLVDELAENEDDLLQKAISKVIEFASVPRHARSVVKSLFVNDNYFKMTQEHIDTSFDQFTSDEVMSNIKRFQESKKKS